MDDNGVGIIIVIGLVAAAVIAAVLIVSSLVNALSQNLFWFGILAGVPIGIGGTLGFLRVRKWIQTHEVVEIENKK